MSTTHDIRSHATPAYLRGLPAAVWLSALAPVRTAIELDRRLATPTVRHDNAA